MAGYQPLKITGSQTGLVQSRENFLLPDDAYPILENAYVFRERILRKGGYELLGRLRRVFINASIGNSQFPSWSFNIYSSVSPPISVLPTTGGENPQIEPGSVTIIVNPSTVTGTITGYNNTTNCEVFCSAPHGLSTGAIISISGVQVVDGSGPNQINGGPYVISVVSATTFTINQNSLAWGIYLSGGTWTQKLSVISQLKDQGNGQFVDSVGSATGNINYATGDVVLTNVPAGNATIINFNYFPGLPVMGLRTREVTNSANDQTIAFDQKYAYQYNADGDGFEEFIPGTTWNAHLGGIDATDFFWSTNYWTSSSPLFSSTGKKLFWVTNNTGQFISTANSDPVRITDGQTWINFYPGAWAQLDSTNFLQNFLCILPFRGRMVTFNTWEGPSNSTVFNYPNRIRWSTIGNPFIAYAPGPPATGSWRTDIRGQGGFLDIPTSEDIISVGFVRDNLVIYCERSTWQLRYTGRSIAPFVIERVNSELGAQSPFSTIQFNTSLFAVGDRGIIECDSYKAQRIDDKIIDLVFRFQNQNAISSDVSGVNPYFRVHGIRDFINKLAYWTYVDVADLPDGTSSNPIFPTNRLVYNYENQSWSIFTDSLTCLGNYQPTSARNWLNTQKPWIECFFPWISQSAEVPAIIGGNQQGFVEYLDELTTNDVSLFITGIAANVTTPTVITSPSHNMETGFVIEISGIPLGTPFASSLNSPQAGLITGASQDAAPIFCQITSADHNLQDGDQITISGVVGMTELNFIDDEITPPYTVKVVDVDHFTLNGIDSSGFTAYSSGGVWTNIQSNVFGIIVTGLDTFQLMKYNPVSQLFNTPKVDAAKDDYIGGGLINIRDNFSIQSKKFNFLDEGQNIQMGYLDILMASTGNGAITLNTYLDYDDVNASNTSPENHINDVNIPVLNPDLFFNSTIPTTQSNLSNIVGTKFWQRVFCPTRSNFLTLQYTLSNAQMAGIEQEEGVQIDAQVLWIRKAGRMTQI